MFPLRDENPTELFPFVTLLLMGACVITWFSAQGAGLDQATLQASVCSLGLIPAEITGRGGTAGPCTLGGLTWEAGFTSMFLHGSWMHLIGNLWFLWIFGNNIEDSMGHGRFLVFYLLCGSLATLAHVVWAPASLLPTVGASGAISGIMGAYLLLYPRVKIATLFVLVILLKVIHLPAWMMLGYWLLIQVVSSLIQGPTGGGVAVWAHIGGFVAGVVLIRIFANPALVQAKDRGHRIPRSDLRFRGWI